MLHATLPFEVDADIDIRFKENIGWSDLSIDTQFGYENEYVYRGQQLADNSFQGFVEASLGGFYTGIWTNLPFSNDNNSFNDEFDFYLGCLTPINEYLQGDMGFKYYFYPEDNDVDIDRHRELHFGLSFIQAPFTPSVYLYYDVDFKQTVFEFSGSKVLDLSNIIPNSNLSFGGSLGLLHADNLDAGQTNSARSSNGKGEGNSYAYIGLNADLIYNFTDNDSFIIGVRYSRNNDDNSFIDTQTGDREDNIWWGIALNSGF